MDKTDYECPICLNLLIKPVSLPCHHHFCLDCFQKHLEVNTCECPICRRRVGCWARCKANELIDNEKWNFIQANFPKRVKRCLKKDDSDSEDDELEFLIRMNELNNGAKNPKQSKVSRKSSTCLTTTKLNLVPKSPNQSKASEKSSTCLATAKLNLVPKSNRPNQSKASEESSTCLATTKLNLVPKSTRPNQNKVSEKSSTFLTTTKLNQSPTYLNKRKKIEKSSTFCLSINDINQSLNISENKTPKKKSTCQNTTNCTVTSANTSSQIPSSTKTKVCKEISRRKIMKLINWKEEQEQRDLKYAWSLHNNFSKRIYEVDRTVNGDNPYSLRQRKC